MPYYPNKNKLRNALELARFNAQESLENAKVAEKEMENGDVLINLIGKVGELGGQVSEGFKATHQRLDVLNGRTKKSEENINELFQKIIKLEKDNENFRLYDDGIDKDKEKRRDWMWGAAEKIIFALVGALLVLGGLVLHKLGILNLQ